MKVNVEKKTLALIGIAVALVVGLAVMFFPEKNQEELITADRLLEEKEAEAEPEEETIEQEEPIKKVDVKGAINRPGVYIAAADDRVLDVIGKAGGFTAQADKNAVNLAQRVEDQMMVYVPAVGEQVNLPTVPAAAGASAASGQTGGKVNINSATEDELQTISGIGPAKAQAIIQYRTEKGAFSSIDELKEISGIGEKTFEKLKDQVTI
ncbi:MAG: helix-hairpin-helix domain-containing protein [Bacillus sp. (in: firmicutes)]